MIARASIGSANTWRSIMGDVDGPTLIIAIRAVAAEISKYKQLIKSDTLRDIAEIQDLVLSYEKAADKLKEAYIREQKGSLNLSDYEALIQQPLSSSKSG